MHYRFHRFLSVQERLQEITVVCPRLASANHVRLRCRKFTSSGAFQKTCRANHKQEAARKTRCFLSASRGVRTFYERSEKIGEKRSSCSSKQQAVKELL